VACENGLFHGLFAILGRGALILAVYFYYIRLNNLYAYEIRTDYIFESGPVELYEF
jgi:hypothetical protein